MGSKTTGAIALVTALLAGLLGLVLLLANWIVGAVVLILALLIAAAGTRQQTALTCPACRTDARLLD